MKYPRFGRTFSDIDPNSREWGDGDTVPFSHPYFLKGPVIMSRLGDGITRRRKSTKRCPTGPGRPASRAVLALATRTLSLCTPWAFRYGVLFHSVRSPYFAHSF